MTVIANTTVNWRLSPRIITIPIVETEVTVEDLQDTLLDLEDNETDGILWPHLRNTSGGEALGGGVIVGLTTELQDAQLAFAPRTTSNSSGTVTTQDTAGILLIDSAADFVSDGVVAGATIVNFTDQSVTSVIEVIDLNTLSCYALADGTDNQFDSADVYKVWNEVQCEITGGNVVAVDSGDSSISPVRTTFGTQIVRTSASSATLQELTAIQFSSFNGGVTIDTTSSFTGTDFPTGTPEQPVNNVTDALSIASSRGLNKFFIIGDITFTTGDNITDLQIEGESPFKSLITVDADAVVNGAEFEECTLQGTLDSNSSVKDSIIKDLSFFEGFFHRCAFEGTITLGGSAETHVIDCHDATPGGGPISLATIDMGGSGRGLIVRNFAGGLELKNKSGAVDEVSIGISRGRLILDSTVTAGEILVRIGAGSITDNSAGATVTADEVLSPQTIADQVWGELRSGHTTTGSFGELIYNLLKVQKNKWKIISNQLIIYEDDGTTPLYTFDLKDSLGDPSETDVFERDPI